MCHRICFTKNHAGPVEVRRHFCGCGGRFLSRLTEKVDIQAYTHKIVKQAVKFEAWEELELAGLLACYCNYKEERVAYITSLSVLPGYRRRGLAGRLLADCVSYASENKFSSISLEVDRENCTAVNFYREVGFRPEGIGGSILLMSLALKT